MKRKFLSFLMLGALVVATTSLVSCKDYDDEVQDLQTQINSLQTLVNTKEASINSTISTMQGTLNNLMGLEALLTGKISDGDAATLAAAKLAVAEAKAALEAAIAAGNAATLATAQQNLADAKAALEAAIASGDTATLAAAQKAVADATAALERAMAAGDAATLAAAEKAVEDATAKLEAAIASGDAAAIAAAQKAVADATAKLEAAFKAGDSETLAAAQKAVDDAKAKLEAAIKSGDEAAVAAAQKALDAATAKLEAAIKAGDDATLAAARKELADAKAALEAAIKSGDAATLAAAKDALAEVKSALEKAIAEGDAATLAAAKAALAEVKAELEAAIKNGDASTLATALDELNKASTELSAAIAKNAADIKKNADDIQTLVGQLADQDAAIKKAQADLAQALIQLEELGSRLGKLEGIVDLAVVDIETIKGQIRKAESEIEQIKNRLNTLEQNYTVLNDKVADALKDIEELWVAVKAQADVLAALGGGQDADAITEALKLLERLSSLENQVEYLIGDNAREVASRLDDHDVTLGQLRAEFANYTKVDEFNGLKENFNELQGKVNTLEGNLSQLGTKVNTLAAALAKALRSLVFQPSLYVDGIESIEYPYLVDTLLVQEPTKAIDRPARTTSGFEDGGKKVTNATGTGLAPLQDYVRRTDLPNGRWNSGDQRYFGPAVAVDYHMNPSKSNPKWEDVKGWNIREAEVITRSTNAKSNILITDKHVDGTQLFNVANGTITVGLQVKNPGLLAHHANPTEADGRPGNLQENGVRSNSPVYDDLLALQVYSDGDIEGEEKKIITSDYAMIYPEKMWPEAIVWTTKPNKLYKNTLDFDEKCPYDGKVHLWKSPYDALGCNDASVYPDIELQWDDAEGIRLADYIGIHYVRECKTKNAKKPGTWKFGEEAQWGYKYEFQLVGYSIDGNVTVDSKYAAFKDADANGVSKEGIIEAWNVDDKGNTTKEKSMTSVDREPLVRVLVKRMADNQVVLDGYILIHITRKAAPQPDPVNLEIDNIPGGKVTFNTCDAADALSINWSQFSYFVLTQKMENMTKEDFDAQYGKDFEGVPDLKTPGAGGTQILGSDDLEYDLQIYDNMNGTKANQYSGDVKYRFNAEGTTNHTFTWTLDGADLEYWTHDKDNLPVTLTKYIRYTKRSAAAKYEYVYVKLVVELNRVKQSTGIQSKNTNYWFSTAGATLGADNGFDAIFFNSQFPQDGNVAFQAPAVFTNDIYNTFVQNKVDFTLTSVFSAYNALGYNKRERNETAKFYFVPEETTITTQAGVTYTITPRPNASDQKWNAFVCKYGFHQYPYQAHKWSTPAENKKILQNCAIDYNDGVFTNNKLYAVNNGTYTHIATLDQNITTGTVDLVFRDPDNDVTKEILNAIGYTADHKNVLTEFHTKVGVVGHNNCGVAIYVDEMETGKDNSKAGTFWVSWQRPINVDTHEKDMVDAKNNGDYVYLVDMLQMYDWRGPVEGKMYGANQWLWAFYNVKSVKIDVTPSKVKTNMHQSNVNTFKPLSQITTRARLRALDASGNAAQTATIVFADNLPSYPTAYNMASMNDKLNKDLGLVPADVAKKALFGGLYYENNGENVEKFDVIVPIEINYGWGRFLASVKVRIDRTLGN